MMAAASISETSEGVNQTTRRNYLEGSHLHMNSVKFEAREK
jgi:hypothetical protein